MNDLNGITREGREPLLAGESGWVHDKRLAGVVTVLTAAALLLPIAQNWRVAPRDSFPLSYYPMFSLKRSKRVRVTYLVGIDARGERHLLPYGCAGTGGFNQVRRQINRAVREDRVETLCQTVAASPLLKRPGPLASILEVRIVSGEYRLADYFSGKDQTPVSERMLAAVPVRRESL